MAQQCGDPAHDRKSQPHAGVSAGATQVPDLIEAWKQGYRKAAVLDKADAEEIPTFVMLRRLLLVAWIGSHAETDLAKSMGLPYTEGTMDLCENYLCDYA